MTEAEGRRWLAKELTGCDVKVQSIESGGTALGIPDLFVRTKRRDAWVELKSVYVAPNATSVKVPWRPGQYSWMMNYVKLKGRGLLIVFFVVEPPDESVAVFRDLNIQREYPVTDFRRLATVCADIEQVGWRQLLQSIDDD